MTGSRLAGQRGHRTGGQPEAEALADGEVRREKGHLSSSKIAS